MWKTKYAVVEHYPDGNSSIINTFETENQARDYVARNYYNFCTIEKIQTITL